MSYLNHTLVPDLYAACIILTVATLTVVVLRCKARHRTKQFGWDDFTVVLAWVPLHWQSFQMKLTAD